MAILVKKSPANGGELRDLGLIPGLGRSPGSLPISSSFVWVSVFLVCPSFVQYFSTLSLFFFLTYCV